ncbi:MAG TPA: T9SS type A sorting domain-containing protein, partial [Chitinophagales bacterium]|nr:T9SS type A sorting domain-containing protein [Chitinophagales bacterium]
KDYEATGRMIRSSGFAQNSDGTITVGGTIDYNSPDRSVIIMNTDSIGNLNWSKLLLTSADAEEARDFKATPDGGFIFCGVRVENGIQHPEFTKTDFDGNTKCGDSALSLVVTDITLTEQSDSMEEVTTGFNSGDSRSFSQMNYDSLSDLCLATGIHDVKNTESVMLFPDPASDMITIVFPDQSNFKSDVSIFDATGKLVRHFINVHSAQLKIPVAEIGSGGLYFCRVMTNDRQIFSEKFLIQR